MADWANLKRGGATATVLLNIAADAVLAASAVGIYLFCIRPQLLARRARWGAFLIAGAVAAIVPVALALTRLGLVPSWVVPVPIVFLLVIWSAPDPFARVTGGKRPLPDDVQRVMSTVTRSWDLFELGDLDAARDEVAPLAGSRPPLTARYVDLWQRFLDEEVARRTGSRESSRGTMRQITEEVASLTMPSRRVGVWLILLLLTVAAIVGSAPAIAYARACIAVEFLLPSQGNDGPAQASPLAVALLASPEPDATLLSDKAMDVEAAAESRHDPDTRAQLLGDGFSAGHLRQWRAADGRQISADVFEFRDSGGALKYHRSVNQYACQFSNEAFQGPGEGVGLQVRWSRGDPIVEQVSWVVGSRRFVVAVSALAPSAHHDRVLGLAQRQREQAVH